MNEPRERTEEEKERGLVQITVIRERLMDKLKAVKVQAQINYGPVMNDRTYHGVMWLAQMFEGIEHGVVQKKTKHRK